MLIADNLKAIQDRINAAAKRVGRDPSSVRLVTVTKTVGIESIREAVSAGAKILGENRVQEAKDKIAELGTIASWHLIGRLQTNKAKYAVKIFDLIHSVDNIDLAQELDKQAGKYDKVQDVLIEVRVAEEASKAGIRVDQASALVRDAAKFNNISIKGLMAVPPYLENAEAVRPYFRMLRELRDRINTERIPRVSMNELSMGMSHDFEVAVEEGATLVRVGTAIFGERR